RNYANEQPIQALNLNAQTAQPSSVGQQPAQLMEIAHQNSEQQPIQEINSVLQSIIPMAFDQWELEQQPVPPQRKKLDHRSYTTMRLWWVCFLICKLFVIRLLVGGCACGGRF